MLSLLRLAQHRKLRSNRRLTVADRPTADSATHRGRALILATDRLPENTSLRERAYVWLRSEIISGHLPFGAVLSPRRLGERIGTSFLPVSDALQQLESEGLVETRDRVGTRVKVPSEQDIRGAYIVREALESQAARLCCELATKEQRAQLRSMAREVDALYAACSGSGFSQELWVSANTFHMRFHQAIAAAANCSRLKDEIERSQVLTLKVQLDGALHGKKRPHNWHRILIAGILQPDPVKADEAARAHIRYGLEESIEAVRQIQVQDRWRS